jgi:hypothetical protein
MQTYKPELVRRFCNMLWANLPNNFVTKFYYQKSVLYVMIILKNEKGKTDKIKREYTLTCIQDRQDDLWGLAVDCADEIRHYVIKKNQ